MPDGDYEIEREMGGIILDEHPVYCGYCLCKMDQVGPTYYVCPSCGMRYDSQREE